MDEPRLSDEELDGVVRDAVAFAQEWTGAEPTERFAAIGLDAEKIAKLLEERLRRYRPADPLTFIRGYVEGLLVNIALVRRNV